MSLYLALMYICNSVPDWAIYILHGQYLALIHSHLKLQFFDWASVYVLALSLGVLQNIYLVVSYCKLLFASCKGALNLSISLTWAAFENSSECLFHITLYLVYIFLFTLLFIDSLILSPIFSVALSVVLSLILCLTFLLERQRIN